MLSADRSEIRADHRADHRRRPAAGAHDDALWDTQSFDPDAPWDDATAEALMCLCESEEGRLWRPADGDRIRPCLRPPGNAATEAHEAVAEGLDRTWLEAHLTGMARQLQDALAEADPKPTLAQLAERLETIEQRFGATLGRVAQRSDLDALRAIETRVLELAAQLEQARERLDRIGAMDDEVRALGRKVEQAGAERTSGLEKLLRDCIAEWREGEQRTQGVLQHIEEAIGRLGEAVDAMEASKPAPDLTVPPLTGAELGRVAGASGAYLPAEPAETGLPSPPPIYGPTLDAADYAPLPLAEDATDAAEVSRPDPALGEGSRPAGARLTPGALRIKALRAKLRQSSNGRGSLSPYVPPDRMGEQRNGTFKRASLSVLLMGGAALVASSTYFLYRTFVTAARTGPVAVAPADAGSSAKSDLAGMGNKAIRQ